MFSCTRAIILDPLRDRSSLKILITGFARRDAHERGKNNDSRYKDFRFVSWEEGRGGDKKNVGDKEGEAGWIESKGRERERERGSM